MSKADPFAREVSLTAANSSNRLFGVSGEMDYLVVLSTQGGGQKGTVVKASTGDQAAEIALGRNPGWRVAYVGPASDAPPAFSPMSAEAAAAA